MRFSFSLRTLFLMVSVVALGCYWLVLPTLNAHRFLQALAAEEYASADGHFLRNDDRFLADWAEKQWGFRALGQWSPWSLSQMCRGQRELHVRIKYFEHDQHALCQATITATPWGLRSAARSPITYSGVLIDRLPQR